MRKFFKKVDRILTAIAHAEAGNLDAVKALLEQDAPTTKAAPATKEPPTPRSAVILDFKRAERPTTKKTNSAANLGVRP